tara:strand:- start:227 stop:4021 length:3795 start_codon:yes stop_codon:yes gene_type:complete
MAFATRTYTPGSSTTTFALTTSGGDPIGYIQQSDISVTVNGSVQAASSYSFSGTSTVEQPNGGNIVLNAGVTGTVTLTRVTSIQNATVTYTAGSTLTAADLNNADNQIRFGLQEFSDTFAALNTGTGDLESLGGFIGSNEAWASNNTKAATTGAIDARVDSKIDTALTTDVSGGDGVTIVDNNPGSGQIRVDLDADIATLRNMQSGAASALAALTSTELQILDGATLTTTELNYVDGVTSAIQTQLDNKQPIDSELTTLATMASGTASALKDLTQAEVEILDGATVTTAELNVLDGIPAGLTATELGYVDGVTSAIQTQIDGKQPLDAELTELATMSSGTASALADLTQTEVQILDGVTATTAEINKLDGVTATTSEINLLDGVTATTAEINKLDGVTATTAEINYVDGVTSNVQTQLNAKQPLDTELTTLSGMQAGTASILASGTALTSTTTELNQLDGKTLGETSLTTNSNTAIPTSKAVADHVAGAVTAVGGFIAIANEVSFPNSQPAANVIVSVSDAGGLSINSSGVVSGATTVGGTSVTITGVPAALYGGAAGNANPNVLAAGEGLQLTSSGSNHSYAYHKILATETDVAQLSGQINDFNERYRYGAQNPTTGLDAGDLFFNTGTGKMLVYDTTGTPGWEEVQSIGNFFISSFLESFDGSRIDFTLSNAPSNAQQVLLSINGVIQKPNSGTARPSEGFSLNGATLQLPTGSGPASGSDYFVIVMGSTVNIGTPSNNTVTTAILQNGSVTNDKVNASAAIAMSKLALSITNAEINASAAIARTKLANVDVVDDTTPQLGGDLQSNGNDIDISDNDKLVIGDGTDLELYHASSNNFLNLNSGTLKIRLTSGADFIELQQDRDVWIKGNPKPWDNNTYALGTSSYKWSSVHATTYYGDGSNLTGINTDLVSDSSPQLGGDLDTNSHHIVLDTSHYLYFITNGGSAFLGKTSSGLYLQNNGDLFLRGDDVYISGDDGSILGKFVKGGASELYFNASKKIETQSIGITVTGQVVCDELNMADSTGAGNNRIKLGTGNDLQIYHNGTDAFINNNDGNLSIQSDGNLKLERKDGGEDYIHCISGGAVELHHTGNVKFETTSTGIKVTGEIEASGVPLQQVFNNSNTSQVKNGTGALALTCSQISMTTKRSSSLLVYSYTVSGEVDTNRGQCFYRLFYSTNSNYSGEQAVNNTCFQGNSPSTDDGDFSDSGTFHFTNPVSAGTTIYLRLHYSNSNSNASIEFNQQSLSNQPSGTTNISFFRLEELTP